MNAQMLQQRYMAALHQVQTGVAMEIARGILDEHPKYPQVGLASARINHDTIMALLAQYGLAAIDEMTAEGRRFGLDMLMVQQGAVTMLLVEKGVFTHAEFFAKLLEMTDREVAMHTERLSRHVGRPVTLV